ncbi:helix-turn-helix domain-containing protein [Corynebacterium diphtheriae]|uniref:helix-turn-helix domain-containing protein n=2 Tax=Corynebacterium diphtheriae TaxID=1717 RepID=UPI002017F157|nr:helix-turn-helix domain-containing protein [Corynebacterium diphtheriae]
MSTRSLGSEGRCNTFIRKRLLMASSPGPFHSLTDADKHRLTELITVGSSVHAAARLLNANYRHCLNYSHHNTLITPRRQSTVVPQQRAAFLTQINNENTSIRRAAIDTELSLSVAYRLARDTGQHTRRSRYQQRVDSTNLRLEYLRLRLACLSQRDAATAVDIGRRTAYDFDHGLSHTGSTRRRFIPNGPHAKAYNTCMTTLAARHDVIEEGRLPAPALPTRIDPYKPINRRYLNIEDRIQIADLYREGHCPAYIARVMGQSRSTITRDLRRNLLSAGCGHNGHRRKFRVEFASTIPMIRRCA